VSKDCPDDSDESYCHRIRLDKEVYSKEDPPLESDHGYTTTMKVKIVICIHVFKFSLFNFFWNSAIGIHAEVVCLEAG